MDANKVAREREMGLKPPMDELDKLAVEIYALVLIVEARVKEEGDPEKIERWRVLREETEKKLGLPVIGDS